VLVANQMDTFLLVIVKTDHYMLLLKEWSITNAEKCGHSSLTKRSCTTAYVNVTMETNEDSHLMEKNYCAREVQSAQV